MNRRLLFFIALICVPMLVAAQKPAYVLYNKKGKQVKYNNLVKDMSKNDVVLFGELHDNPIAHWLQLETLKEVANKADVILGGEFFEADVQVVIDEYMAGLIPMAHLEREARVWPNFSTDYRPLLSFAQENNVPFVATNIPRRYAGFAAKHGKDSLEKFSEQAKGYMVPLPFTYDEELKSYKQMKDMAAHAHGMKHMVDAQAVKDATMAHRIMKHREEGKVFFHINGAYHSDYYEGIYWFLNQENPEMSILTITTVEAENPEKLEEEVFEKADYIIAVPKTMTSTH
ncbi:ChaN family lipoprotein [Cytophagaceae bacterium ABcell3]|nr:ChaN family lipoprotein [Cytophagaceae bacterium ABcell3]